MDLSVGFYYPNCVAKAVVEVESKDLSPMKFE